MVNANLSLPTQIKVLMGKTTGASLLVETSRLPAIVLEAIVVAGVKVILANSYNGGGKDESHETKLATATKKRDAWYRGEFNVIERGDSMVTAMKEVFVSEWVADNAATPADADKEIRRKVKSAFGEKESATFGRYMDATALELAREDNPEPTKEQIESAREAVEGYYRTKAEAAIKERAEAAAKITVKKLDLSKFKKAES